MDNFAETVQFYFPLQGIQISYWDDTNLAHFNTCDVVICYHVKIKSEFETCKRLKMNRKFIGVVDTSTFHVVKLQNILYSLWMPHACQFHTNTNQEMTDNMCMLTPTEIIHNCQTNNQFFVGCFAKKWIALNYVCNSFLEWTNLASKDSEQMDVEELVDSDDSDDSDDQIEVFSIDKETQRFFAEKTQKKSVEKKGVEKKDVKKKGVEKKDVKKKVVEKKGVKKKRLSGAKRIWFDDDEEYLPPHKKQKNCKQL